MLWKLRRGTLIVLVPEGPTRSDTLSIRDVSAATPRTVAFAG